MKHSGQSYTAGSQQMIEIVMATNSIKDHLSKNITGSLVECAEWADYPGMFGTEYNTIPENITGSLVECAEWTNYPGLLGVVIAHDIEWDEVRVYVGGRIKSFTVFDLYCLS